MFWGKVDLPTCFTLQCGGCNGSNISCREMYFIIWKAIKTLFYKRPYADYDSMMYESRCWNQLLDSTIPFEGTKPFFPLATQARETYWLNCQHSYQKEIVYSFQYLRHCFIALFIWNSASLLKTAKQWLCLHFNLEGVQIKLLWEINDIMRAACNLL